MDQGEYPSAGEIDPGFKPGCPFCELPADRFADASAAYTAALQTLGFKIIRERKNPAKHRLTLIFIGGRSGTAGELEGAIASAVDLNLRGTIDLELN